MKIIHCSDVHLGSKMLTNLSADKAKKRREEILDTFERMINYAEENKISSIIIAGDLFDYKKDIKSVVKTTLAIIRAHNKIKFFYLEGNHDNEILSDFALPENLYLFGNKFVKYDFENISIGGLDITKEYDAKEIVFDKSKYNILVLHGNVVNGKKSSSEDINLKEFAGLNINYIALGHIHEMREYSISNNFKANYSGCLEGRGFDEIGPKGFIVIDIENNKAIDTFVPFSKRVFYEVQVDISECKDFKDITEKIDEKTANIKKEDLIKIILKGKYISDLNKNLDRIEEQLNQKYFFLKIYDESQLKINYTDYENDISLMGEFVRVIHKDSSLTEEEKNQILSLGMKALNGEDLS